MNNEEKAPVAADTEMTGVPECKEKSGKSCCAVKTFVIALLTSVIAVAVYHCIMVYSSGCDAENKDCQPPQPSLHIYHHFDDAPECMPGKFRHHPAEHHVRGDRNFRVKRRPDVPVRSRMRMNRKDKHQSPTPEQAD
jgi:hypothetical protein